LFEFFITIGFYTGESTDELELFMEFFVPEGAGLGNGGVEDDGLVLDLDF
jgi:hypothetical protein